VEEPEPEPGGGLVVDEDRLVFPVELAGGANAAALDGGPRGCRMGADDIDRGVRGS
jgi:hypothetical protein